MANLNHFICPNCRHDFYAEAAYATCDACQTFFYVSQSMTVSANRLGMDRLDCVPRPSNVSDQPLSTSTTCGYTPKVWAGDPNMIPAGYFDKP